ncbi:MAG: hypothetical protein NTZ83_01585 [Candidatus Pacearchaeota archaeon]|nr:hypothetical protein [Candidatus Pacearchaeota archaeon]
MGIWNFLKKILSEEEKVEPIKEKITLSNIEEFIKKEIEKTKEEENKDLSLIHEKIKFFTAQLKENAKIANNVDIESKEKNDKIKSAVYEGRKKYLEFLEKFLNNLEKSVKSEEINLEKTIEEINSAFLRFSQNSGKSYERATILIGKEMGNIREIIKRFSSELLDIFNENKEIISTSKRLSLIQIKLNENRNLNEKHMKTDERTALLDKKIQEKEKESKNISGEIEKIKNSPEYLENINKMGLIESGEKEIEKEMSELRQIIDFKALSNFFHIFEDRMAIVKLYRDDFIEEFKKDKGSRLLNLLNESKLNNEKVIKFKFEKSLIAGIFRFHHKFVKNK